MTPSDSKQQSRRQRLRLERLAIALAACLMTVGLTISVALVGYLPYTVAAIYIGLVAGLCALFFVIIRSGLNRRFSDPSLTVPQLVAAGLAVSYVAYEGVGVTWLDYKLAVEVQYNEMMGGPFLAPVLRGNTAHRSPWRRLS